MQETGRSKRTNNVARVDSLPAKEHLTISSHLASINRHIITPGQHTASLPRLSNDMGLKSEFDSWFTPDNPETSEPPAIGQQAPSSSLIDLEPNKRTVITFLRHCGCPFAEKTFIRIREAAKTHRDIDFIAVSHSAEEDTQTWLKSLPQHGSEPGNLRVIVDSKKEAFAAWVSRCQWSFH